MNDKDGNEQCIYCLREFATAAQKRQHEITFHESMISFKVKLDSLFDEICELNCLVDAGRNR
jgi:hypothetical protein